jgi:acyl-CoA thioester hydrolase
MRWVYHLSAESLAPDDTNPLPAYAILTARHSLTTQMVYTHRIRVRYAETDAMGVAHHAAYLVWLEEGRVEGLRDLGFSFAEVEASGYGHAVREVRIQYRRPVRFDQMLVLQVALVYASGPRMTFGYRLYDASEFDAAGQPGSEPAVPVAVAFTEMIWVTPQGRPTRLPVTHPLHGVIAAQESHPDWAEW